MLSVGLTGGIATGKSLVSVMFKELGAYIIDADIISRNLVEPGQPAYQEIIDLFGSDIINDDCSLNRKKLGKIVFADYSLKKKLEEMIHPRVIEEQLRLLNKISSEDKGAVAIVDAPLIIESGFYKKLETLIVVTASEESVVKRLFERNGLSKDEALLRISAQTSIEKKEALANYVIDNNGEIEETQRQVTAVMAKLRGAEQKKK